MRTLSLAVVLAALAVPLAAQEDDEERPRPTTVIQDGGVSLGGAGISAGALDRRGTGSATGASFGGSGSSGGAGSFGGTASGGETAAGEETAAGGKSASGGASGKSSGAETWQVPGLRWRVYERLGLMPRPASYTLGHGYGNLREGEGIAVGFMTAPAGRSGHCGITPSPALGPLPEDCPGFTAWVSERPGGPPLGDGCRTLDTLKNFGANTPWASVPHPYGRRLCDVKPSTKYYCNVAGCPGLVNSPMGVNDYTEAESRALKTGKSCNVRGSGAVGAFGADGVCRCVTDLCRQIDAVRPTLPKCTNEIFKIGGTCYSCGSAQPANCGGANKLVQTCGLACR